LRAKREPAFFHPFLRYTASLKTGKKGILLLPGALLVTVQTQLLAPFVSVDFGLAAFLK
jgi:hypothetical protein